MLLSYIILLMEEMLVAIKILQQGTRLKAGAFLGADILNDIEGRIFQLVFNPLEHL